MLTHKCDDVHKSMRVTIDHYCGGWRDIMGSNDQLGARVALGGQGENDASESQRSN